MTKERGKRRDMIEALDRVHPDGAGLLAPTVKEPQTRRARVTARDRVIGPEGEDAGVAGAAHPTPGESPYEVELYLEQEVRDAFSDESPATDAFVDLDCDEYELPPNWLQKRFRWFSRGPRRRLARGTPRMLVELDALSAVTPNMGELTEEVGIRIRAAMAMDRPVWMPPLVLLGPAGIGKTFYLKRLGRIIGVPFREYPMNGATLSEGLQGAHRSWKSAAPGIVADTLLNEGVANPVMFVDEIDKVSPSSSNADPHRAFLTLLERENAASFRDEYLQFNIRADHVLWVMAANDLDKVPGPVRDRMTVLSIPRPDRDQRRVIARSIYSDLNATNNAFFDPSPSEALLEAVADRHPRAMKKAIDAAMARAASRGRSGIERCDVDAERTEPRRERIGFAMGRDAEGA